MFQTLAGFAVMQLGRVPSSTDAFEWEGMRFEIVDMDGQRVDKLLVSRIASPDHASGALNGTLEGDYLP
jgi:putative hemolysin